MSVWFQLEMTHWTCMMWTQISFRLQFQSGSLLSWPGVNTDRFTCWAVGSGVDHLVVCSSSEVPPAGVSSPHHRRAASHGEVSGLGGSFLLAHQVTSTLTSDRHCARWPSHSICENLARQEQQGKTLKHTHSHTHTSMHPRAKYMLICFALKVEYELIQYYCVSMLTSKLNHCFPLSFTCKPLSKWNSWEFLLTQHQLWWCCTKIYSYKTEHQKVILLLFSLATRNI